MPFALLALSEPQPGMVWVGRIGTGLAFLLVGAGMQVTQTAGLALASDLATPENRPRVVALMYTMLLLGLVGSGARFAGTDGMALGAHGALYPDRPTGGHAHRYRAHTDV